MFEPVNQQGGPAGYDAERFGHAQPLAWLLVCVSLGAGAAEPANKRGDDYRETIIARAHEAWESPDGGTMFIRGNLELRGTRWRIQADAARIEGKLGKPDTVVVDGAPARLVVTPEDDSQPFEGHSRHLEFRPQAKTVRLEGAATIVKGQQSITSESIRYELDSRTLAAGARGRVKVVTSLPSKSRE